MGGRGGMEARGLCPVMTSHTAALPLDTHSRFRMAARAQLKGTVDRQASPFPVGANYTDK